MKFIVTVIATLSVAFSTVFSQQLIINEISQGSGAKEYVELAVVGSSTCSTPIPCLDLRGVILDDNDGSFSASSSGSGVAAGAVRFANVSFWSCIPQGTIIVVYNESDQNAALPADDQSMTDGNCKLVLPINSPLFEAQSLSPSSGGSSNYPNTGWTAGAGAWSQVAMSNSNDSFQIRNSTSSSAASFSVSWGNNSQNTMIYFSSASGSVFSMTNTTTDDPSLQANWSLGSVGTDETPGAPNNTANAAWLSAMNPQCGVGTAGLQVTLAKTDESCFNACDGTITTSVTNGVAPYTYAWSNGATTSGLTALCPGTYVVQVTDQNGCSENESITILAGASTADATIQAAGPFTTSSAAYQMTAATTGGVWSSDCGICLSSTGVFDPAVSGQGTFEICYTVGAGSCMSSECIYVIVSDCTPQTTSESVNICPGDSVTVNGQVVTSNESLSQLFTDINGCDSTHTVNVQLFPTSPMNFLDVICSGDSVLVLGNWIAEDFITEEVFIDANGCELKDTYTVEVEDCFEEEFHLYIPNVITANADGVNDVFEVVLEGGVLNEGFIINRWGQTIAILSDHHRTWDGTSKVGFTYNKPVSAGVYTYIIEYTPTGKVAEKVHGSVTVLR